MACYAAFLRGVSPMNLRMPDLKRCFEAAGFLQVRTLRSSGNVVFSTARASTSRALERRIEAAMREHLGQSFLTLLRPVAALQSMLRADPFRKIKLSADSKRVITFLRQKPNSRIALPLEYRDARILSVRGTEVFSTYVPGPHGPAFMSLIERTFGKEVTTRTWEAVSKAAASPLS
jgi:uncharacterized protein (DUF1697 family)